MNQYNPKVSVIIPAYNEQKNIRLCLRTILDQSYKNFEVIVIDDGSTDKTVDIIKEFDVKLLVQNHQGPAKARNKVAKEAKGDILVFMDADMSFSSDFLTDIVKPIVDGKFRGVFSKEEYVSNWQNLWARCWNYNQNLKDQRMIPADYPDEGLDFRAILKSEFLKIGGFDDVGYTDTWTLTKKLGYNPQSVKGAKYFHANPDNLKEVFTQSKWSAKREYKYGYIGILIALLRFALPFSVIIGMVKSIRYKEPRFLIFKIIYDFGGFIGLLEMLTLNKLTK